MTGKVDYLRLAKEFGGVQLITDEDLGRLRELAGGDVHPLLRRGYFYAHRDLNQIIERQAGGVGGGPSTRAAAQAGTFT